MKLENGVCTSSEANMTGQISKDMVCAGGGDTDACVGDSGIVGLHSQSNSLANTVLWG